MNQNPQPKTTEESSVAFGPFVPSGSRPIPSARPSHRRRLPHSAPRGWRAPVGRDRRGLGGRGATGRPSHRRRRRRCRKRRPQRAAKEGERGTFLLGESVKDNGTVGGLICGGGVRAREQHTWSEMFASKSLKKNGVAVHGQGCQLTAQKLCKEKNSSSQKLWAAFRKLATFCCPRIQREACAASMQEHSSHLPLVALFAGTQRSIQRHH